MRVCTGERVVEVTEGEVRCASGLVVPAEIRVWSAGVKAPDFLGGIDGLETNRVNQLVVDQTLTTTRDDSIYAIGDCAAVPQPGRSARSRRGRSRPTRRR